MQQIQPQNSNKHGGFSAKIKNIFKTLKGALNSRRRRHHRRDLEDEAEELLQREFEDEELFGREEYDDYLVERDAFDDDLD